MIAYPAFFFLISDPFASELVIDMPGLRDRHHRNHRSFSPDYAILSLFKG
jgi:hypothetical protein